MSTFAETVRRRRERLGLSHDDVAERAAIHVLAVGDLELGRGWPMPNAIGRLAEALDLPVEQLVEAAESDQWGDGPRDLSIYRSEDPIEDPVDGEGEPVEIVTREQLRAYRDVMRAAMNERSAKKAKSHR